MASQARTLLQASRRTSICSTCYRRQVVSGVRWSSVDSPAPPLLAKIKADLKTAMRNKDTARLNVLRAIIAETNKAAKESTPISNDMQVLSMLRKRQNSSQTAQKEAREQNREDIAAKEQSEIDVIEQYASEVHVMSEEDIKSTIKDTVLKLREGHPEIKTNQMLQAMFKPGGALDGKPVDRRLVVKVVGDVLTLVGGNKKADANAA